MVTVENRKFFRAASKFKQYVQSTLLILKFSSKWSYCELHQGLLNTPGLKTLQNLRLQIEISFIVESFLTGKHWSLQHICVKPLELSTRNKF